MRTIQLGATGLQVPVIALGCMRIGGMEQVRLEHYLKKCLELGVNFFDHADIYGGGECETLFSKALPLTPSVREQMILQSK